MRKHGGTPSQRGTFLTLAAISPPGVIQGRFVGGHQSGLARCKPPPLFKRRASSYPVTAAMPGGTKGRLPTYLCKIEICIMWSQDHIIENSA